MESNYDVMREAANWMILIAYFIATTQLNTPHAVRQFGYITTVIIALSMLML